MALLEGDRGRPTAVRVVVAVAVAAVALAASAPAPATAAADAPWSYFGVRGPAFWWRLQDDWKSCDSGREQSPVDLVTPFPVGTFPLRRLATQMATGVFRPKAVANGFKYDCVTPGSCGSAEWAGFSYDFVQTHLHVSTEHMRGGEVLPSEIHLVHASPEEELLVVGVLFRLGKASPQVEKLLVAAEIALSLTNPQPNTTVSLTAADWAALVPPGGGWCHYPGSLTTPPCTEGVTWAVATDVRTASEAQLRRLGNVLLDAGSVVLTERPTQPINDRTVTCYSGA